MQHLSRALATARIEDLHRAAAQTRTIRLARRVTHESSDAGHRAQAAVDSNGPNAPELQHGAGGLASPTSAITH